jgi:carbon storage regulator
MLVLSRKKGERIRVGNEIEIVIADVQGERVRLGFRAPPEVAIHREEVFQRLQMEQAERQKDYCTASAEFPLGL